MKFIAISPICIYLSIVLLLTMACTKQPFIADYGNTKGYVFGKESCQSNEANDYWLLDFTIDPDAPKIGETITYNGTSYTNVLKVKGLDPRLKQIGMRVSIDYNKTSADKILSSDCQVVAPVTYPLKELFIINQFEIR